MMNTANFDGQTWHQILGPFIAWAVLTSAKIDGFSAHTPLPQATATQYAQDFRHGSSAVDYETKSKKSAKPKRQTTGQARSTNVETDTAK